jgi:hypothetical protein
MVKSLLRRVHYPEGHNRQLKVNYLKVLNEHESKLTKDMNYLWVPYERSNYYCFN